MKSQKFLQAGKLYKGVCQILVTVSGDNVAWDDRANSLAEGEVFMYVEGYEILMPNGTVAQLNGVVKLDPTRYLERAL